MPFARVSANFWSMALDGTFQVQLELVMRAPIPSAQASASTTQLDRMFPVLSHARLETIMRADADFTPGAMPTIPRPLFMIPEIHPATAVPWLSHALTG